MYQSPTLCNVAVTLRELLQEKTRQKYWYVVALRLQNRTFGELIGPVNFSKPLLLSSMNLAFILHRRKRQNKTYQNNCNEKKTSSCNNVSYLGSVSLKHLYHSDELCLMNIITNVAERCKEVHYSQFKHKNKQKWCL